MGTEIKSWQIVDGMLRASDSTLAAAGRTEPYDLEPWIEFNPEVVGGFSIRPEHKSLVQDVLSKLSRAKR